MTPGGDIRVLPVTSITRFLNIVIRYLSHKLLKCCELHWPDSDRL